MWGLSETEEAQLEYFKEHREEILKSGYRFATVDVKEIRYYNKREDIYKDYPRLHPDAPIRFGGTSPLLIDIGKETNSLEYRIEKNQEDIEKCDSMLEKFSQKKYGLKKEAKELKREKRMKKELSKFLK